VRAVVIVVPHVVAKASQQTALSEHDEVVDNFASQRSDETFDVAILTGRPRRDAELLDAT
jgi:hypothetical protein